MNWFMSQVVSKITYAFRVVQFLLALYFILDIIYWFCAVFRFSLTVLIGPLFNIPLSWVNSFAGIIKWNVGEKFSMLHPDIFVSIFFILIILIVFNVVFIWFGEVEKKYVEKSYDKGERDYK